MRTRRKSANSYKIYRIQTTTMNIKKNSKSGLVSLTLKYIGEDLLNRLIFLKIKITGDRLITLSLITGTIHKYRDPKIPKEISKAIGEYANSQLQQSR